MKKLLIALIPVLLLACTKEKDANDPQVIAFQSFLGKYMVCDSAKTTANGITTKEVLGKGKGSDFLFSRYGTFTVYTNPEATYSFQFQVPDKLYYWKDTYNENQYYIVNSMAGSKMTLQSNEAGRTVVKYYTAE